MRLASLLAALAALLSSSAAAADPPLPPWYPLQPWQLTALHTSNPQNPPYGTNATILEVGIANPSLIAATPAPHASGGGYVDFAASAALCVLRFKTDDVTPWYVGDGFLVLVMECRDSVLEERVLLFLLFLFFFVLFVGDGHATNSCVAADDNASAAWEMTLLEMHEDLDHYMSLSFALLYNEAFYGTPVWKRFSASVTLRAGDGEALEGGCNAGGICTYDLKNGSAPLLLQPSMTECKGTCS
ncbi:Uu.00g013920.m01.CDS01 [Anthostomella pinea]|uniref:Uu.00g013920.m01.CDS01 n=1 Tax=Anthostomella pinea TaxID=933095 RepID=A0AAI8VZG4_9PEZI|nr:Uu.00g013920.m01.CDS01 [Anthostomella pinea]